MDPGDDEQELSSLSESDWSSLSEGAEAARVDFTLSAQQRTGDQLRNQASMPLEQSVQFAESTAQSDLSLSSLSDADVVRPKRPVGRPVRSTNPRNMSGAGLKIHTPQGPNSKYQIKYQNI